MSYRCNDQAVALILSSTLRRNWNLQPHIGQGMPAHPTSQGDSGDKAGEEWKAG
jgi:hypothetical protein